LGVQDTESEAAARLRAAFERVRKPMRRGRMVMVRRKAGWTRSVARDADHMPLTAREREVLGLVAGGLRGTEIAEHLVLSPETIKSHVHNAMTKLGAHTRAHAVAIALRTAQIETLTVGQEQPDAGADALSAPLFGLPRAGALQ
jgi:DNA-binding NarL/FixJ family response regulator